MSVVLTEAELRVLPIGSRIVVTEQGEESPCFVLASEQDDRLNVVTPFKPDPTRVLYVDLCYRELGVKWSATR